MSLDLFETHQKWALSISKRRRGLLGRLVGHDILDNAALIGLFKAVKGFKGGDFQRYAAPRVRGEVLNCIKFENPIFKASGMKQPGLLSEIEGASKQPEDKSDLKEVAEKVLSFYSERERRILRRIFVDGLTISEISSELRQGRTATAEEVRKILGYKRQAKVTKNIKRGA